ncbi:MAG: peptidylprolyl isomerase [Candidatus Tectomicrobia bacterium]|nr:peptidylprolyl isomerase [Candidatus Tectomicrobia bacterium]
MGTPMENSALRLTALHRLRALLQGLLVVAFLLPLAAGGTPPLRLLGSLIGAAAAGAQEATDFSYQLLVVRSRAEAERLAEMLRGGASFADLARQYSIGPNAAQGGRIGALPLSLLAPALRGLASELPLGAVSQPLETPFGFVLLRKSSDRALRQGIEALQAGEYRRAVEHFERDLRLNPTRALARQYLARAQEESGEFDRAADLYVAMLRGSSAKAPLLDRLGGARAKAGKIEEAIDAYRQAMRADPSYAGAFNNLAWLYAQQGMQLEPALRLVRQALRLDPTQLAFHDTLATLAAKLGYVDQELVAIDAAVFLSRAEAAYLERRRELLAEVSRRRAQASPAAAAGEAADSMTRALSPAPAVKPEDAAPAAPAVTEQPPAPPPERPQEQASVRPGGPLRIKVLSGARTQQPAREVLQRLKGAGYPVERFDRHERDDWTSSIVYYKPQARTTAEVLARHVGGDTNLRPLNWSSIFDIIIVVGNPKG